ncbi:MAG: mannose-1-phosphate guanylyltransferase [Candidatus Omnitrophota bacterium]
MNYAIILAGGSGTRFWPLSTEVEPKQFLNICSDKPMIEQAIKRIGGLIEKQNIHIATNEIYHKKIKGSLKGLNILTGNILFEPQARNTFAPISLLAEKIYKRDKDAVILVFPSDHYIKNNSKFINVLQKAIHLAKKGFIVTLGVIPVRPETGYGYIKAKSKKKNYYLIERFVEKPKIAIAKKFIKDKDFYWNTGIFVFRADILLGEIKKFMPLDYRLLTKVKDNKDLNSLWPRLTSISIDYAIMEKTKKMALVPADFGWTDLGSWEAIGDLLIKDKNGNISIGNCIDLGSKNTLCWSNNRILATIGLENIIIVNTDKATLVCAKDKTQEVKKLVGILKEKIN